MDDKIKWLNFCEQHILLTGRTEQDSFIWYVEPSEPFMTEFNICITTHYKQVPKWLYIKCKNAPTFQTVDAAKNYCEHLQELWVYREKNSYINSN